MTDGNVKRKREKALPEAADNYFTSGKRAYQFVNSGCSKLDCDLGGGWALGRIANIVGDQATAKTGLGMEAIANFIKQYPEGTPAYRDCEAAFDLDYYDAMGIPVDKIDYTTGITTVEQFAKDFDQFLEARKKGQPGIYVLDSLDALSDEAEMERELGEATYGMQKAKLLSEFFRTTAGKVGEFRVLLLIVSQVRDNIGAMFGEKHKRSGGRALNFYASQIIWLSHIKTLKRQIKGIERPYGVVIKAKVKKNKVGLPLRECEFEYHWGYGVEDNLASLQFLKDCKRLESFGDLGAYYKRTQAMNDAEYHAEGERLAAMVKEVWSEVETTFLPTRRKY
jgi:protein RecA